MPLVVMFSTMSFTIDMHYCGNHLVGTSFFGKAKTCGMEQGKTNDKSFDGCSISKKNCCSDEQLIIQGQDDLETTVYTTLTVEQQQLVVAFFQTYINLYGSIEKEKFPYQDHPPPLIVRNIHKLHEVYLI